MTRELIYGRRAVREALRGPREVLELWVTERALKAEPWLNGMRRHVKPERELSEAAGTRDHQGVLAWAEPFRYADAYELATVDSPLLVCLDQVTDPHNLGAVARTAEAAGATGVVVPAHNSARVTPAVSRAARRTRGRCCRGPGRKDRSRRARRQCRRGRCREDVVGRRSDRRDRARARG